MSASPSLDFDDFVTALPQAMAALRTLSQSAGEGLDQGLVELIKVRASQLNGCAYCLQLHVNWARKAGVAAHKLDQLAVWHEAAGFTAAERAALAWSEAVTEARAEQTAEAREALHDHFSDGQVLRLTLAVAAINAWNRIAGPLRFTPPPAE